MKKNIIILFSTLIVLFVIWLVYYYINRGLSFEEKIEKDKMCVSVYNNSFLKSNETMQIYKYSPRLNTCILYFEYQDTFIIYDLLDKSNIYLWKEEEEYKNILKDIK